jgi:hypothetical protein
VSASELFAESPKPKGALALHVSLALHAVGLLLLGRVDWPRPQVDLTVPTTVIWRPVTAPPPEPLVEPIETPVDAPAEPVIEESPEPLDEPPVETEPEPEIVADDAESPIDAAGPLREYIRPRPDWQRELEIAAEIVLEQQRREAGYSTFALEGFGEEAEPVEPGLQVDIFEVPPRQRSFLSTGMARSRAAQRFAEICNDLFGGGIGISLLGFNVGTICADPAARADWFGFLRPDYMNSLPDCTVVDAPSPFPPEDPRSEQPTIKCRLVLKDEFGLARRDDDATGSASFGEEGPP